MPPDYRHDHFERIIFNLKNKFAILNRLQKIMTTNLKQKKLFTLGLIFLMCLLLIADSDFMSLKHQHQVLVKTTEAAYEPVPLMHAKYAGGDGFFHWSKIEKQVIEELGWLKAIDVN